jgi:pyrroline-5-carboxylate reductase
VADKFPGIAILGAGNMGGAIVAGLKPSLDADNPIRVTTQSRASAGGRASDVVMVRSLEDDPGSNLWAVEDAEIVILGVKPRYILELLSEIASHAKPDAVMVSIAAGVTISQLEAVWPGAVIRTMPNTPAQVGKGVTGLSVGSRVSASQVAAVTSIFESVGAVIRVEETQINALSTFSGSGPAFVYFFIERFVEVAKEFGFSNHDARVMVEETFAGAMDLLEASGETPQALREAVTSPGGTTQAALAVYEEADLSAVIRAASNAAIARALELSGD